jgi:(+)-trans-carveol dehydrogenase/(-)-trans-carveol dehydrogenase
MGKLDGKVAFITGAARGQGRSHAIRLAQEGADIIAVDICEDIASVAYPLSTEVDLAETVKAVEALDRRIIATKVDVRDYAGLKAAVDHGVAEFGRLDIVCANAGIGAGPGLAWEAEESGWMTTVDVTLVGVWRTCKVAIPHIIGGGNGGSIILTSSAAALKVLPHLSDYSSAKHGVVGLGRTLALELAPHSIRVNTICPGNVDTPQIQNETVYRLFLPHLENPTRADFEAASQGIHALPIPWLEPVDISNAVLFLASDDARYITGATLPVDAGLSLK